MASVIRQEDIGRYRKVGIFTDESREKEETSNVSNLDSIVIFKIK
jgi:hypothetical protein